VNTTAPQELDDGELVTRSIAGDVEAFREIVARYYLLIRMLAYDATGRLGQSDSLARDTFVAAWKQLADLREPARLRSWLCGSARSLTDGFLCRRDTRGCESGSEQLILGREGAELGKEARTSCSDPDSRQRQAIPRLAANTHIGRELPA